MQLRSSPLGNGRNLLNTHCFQCLLHRTDNIAHFVFIDCANASNSKRFNLRQFARIQDVPAVARHLVESLEVVCRIGRCVESDDDRRLHRRGEDGLNLSFAIPSINAAQLFE